MIRNLPGRYFKISPRRELRFALLAAAETCWVYSVLAFIAVLMGSPRTLSSLSIFFAYWLALLAGRTLPTLKWRWGVLQAITLGIALVTLLTILRAEVYTNYGFFDLAWLPRYVISVLTLRTEIPLALVATIGVFYVFIRGLGFGQRPLTLWFTGFQFRLGIVVFFLLFLAASLVMSYDATAWIIIYFFVSLVAIALARMDDMSGVIPLGPRWAVTLIASAALVIFLGLAILQFFTLQSAGAIFMLLAPLAAIFGALFFIFLIPFSFVAEWLINLLAPIFGRLKGLYEIMPVLPSGAEENWNRLQQNAAVVEWLLPVLRTLLVIGLVIGAGYWLARMLNRRMKQYEDEEYTRELMAGDERDGRVRESRRSQPRPRHHWDETAESIRRIYAALVARAAEAGLPRRAAETPYEFLPRLKHAFPEETPQMDTITEAYIAVHYAEEQAAPEKVNRVREAWQRVEKRMRRQSQGKKGLR